MTPRPVIVRWLDIEGLDDWQDEREALDWVKTDFPVCNTAGFIVYDEPDRIAVCSSMFPGGTWGSMHRIPRGNVVEIIELERVDERAEALPWDS